MIGHGGVVLVYAQNVVEARDGASGDRLWRQEVPASTGGESEDLFVANGVVWRGMVCVDENREPVGKSADAMAVGFDLRTGEEKKRIVVPDLRSPEHHHRCYRNKATERYLISGMEGAEFMDLSGDNHGQNNWLRGACKLGVMPCNGLLYVPADQCFCQPGAKLLGFAAVAAGRDHALGLKASGAVVAWGSNASNARPEYERLLEHAGDLVQGRLERGFDLGTGEIANYYGQRLHRLGPGGCHPAS